MAHRWARPVWHSCLESTNTELVSNPESGAVVVTDNQTGGYGRRGRSWATMPGQALAVSCATRVPAPSIAGWVPLVTGMAVVRALRESNHPVAAAVKWPNDVLVADGSGTQGRGQRKISGILAQVVPDIPGQQSLVVIGVGLNINQDEDELPVPTATSWRIARGGRRLPATLASTWLTAYLRELDHVLGQLEEDPTGVAQDFAAMCQTLGQEVRVDLPGGGHVTGIAVDIEASGALVVQGSHGRSVHHAGDVVHLRGR